MRKVKRTFPRYELAFWAVVVAAAMRCNFYYIVTLLSFCATRMYWVLWPLARVPVLPWLVLVFLSIWCLFLTPAHVVTFTPLDLWTPYSIHTPLNPIEVVHDPGKNAVVDVFAIHGLGSNPDSAWTYKENATEIRWLKDLLPKEQGISNTRVVMVNHRTHWDANTVDASFEDHAEMILNEVESVHKSDPQRPIIFIAHSFGGLLLKQTLLLAKLRSSPIAAMTRGILFLGVPHSGTKATFLASLLSCTTYWRGSSTSLLEYMAPDSEHIKDLEKKFYNVYAHPHSSQPLLPYICDFQEMRSEKIGRLSLAPRNQTVDRNSGRSSHGDVVQLDTDHRGLNKFRSPQDPNFRRFLRHFIMAFETATSVARFSKKLGHNHGTKGVSADPGADLKEYDIPFQLDFFRNDKFTGRTDVLDRVHESLSRRHEDHRQPNFVVLQGMGGVGKTELAVEYAHLHQESYSSVFWVDCSTENSVHLSFVRIASRILRHYAGKTAEPATHNAFAARLGLKGLVDEKGFSSTLDEHALDVVEAMRNWFAESLNREWLLIFDNLDDLDAFNIMDYVPRAAWGSILITSRRREFLSYGTAIEISEMSPEEGLKFLTSIARFGRDLNPDEQQLALKLLQSLGYFPLAIEQAGAYISQRISDDPESYSHALANYLDSYERNAKMLLRYRRFSGVWSNRNDSALTTWEVSFNAIKQESSEASDLLQLCGFLANSDIFEEMFRLGLQLPANVTFRSAHDAFSIHPLVQLWVRERVTLDVQQRLANDAFQLVARSLRLKNEEKSRDYTAFERRIIPHLDNVVDNMRRFLSSFTTEVSIRPPSNPIRQSPLSLFYDTIEGWYLWVWGAMTDISIFGHGFFLSDIESSSEKWQLAYKLGSTYRNQFLHQSSERVYGWAFTEARKQLHQKHPKTLEIAGDLAWSIHLQGRYHEAWDWYSWLLASRKKVLGKDHPSTLGATKGLGSVSEHTGNSEQALQLFFEAFAGRQKRLGRNDILTIHVMQDIAGVFRSRGNYSEALRWYEQILSGQQETLGATHTDTLKTIHNIGVVSWYQGKSKEALRWHEQGLSGEQQTLGEKHADTLDTIHKIGRILLHQEAYTEALIWYKRALPGEQEILGDKHQTTLETIYNIAVVFEVQENYEEALVWYKRALAGEQEMFGETNYYTLQTVSKIAVVLGNQGKYEEAMEWHERALAGQQQTLGEKHEDTLDTIHDIGRIFHDQRKYKEALKWYRRALAGQNQTVGEKHQDTLLTIYNIGRVFHDQREYEEALRWYERCLSGEQETLGEIHEFTLITIHEIGAVFQGQGQYEEALRWYERALAGRQLTLGERHRATYKTLHSIRLIRLGGGGGSDLHQI
ncbi:uncharacterized protein N7506_012015 [Penicillium brevicompactum]|uniref:uncharacterized protein n=1 Tax=Penicillium brevicompactum TaxID=5074 RepID=UPI002541BE46|nr:uncharacterized protein N7506_012015 [Penicillium brevicompactum]KAJ5319311.1 hypothetical protein N7506_012015 [Penicillium brevicompactum]